MYFAHALTFLNFVIIYFSNSANANKVSHDPRDVKFLFFPRLENGQEILSGRKDTIPESFTIKKPTILLIHGFWGTMDSDLPKRYLDAFLREDSNVTANILVVNWEKLARSKSGTGKRPVFLDVVKINVPIVADRTANLLIFLKEAGYIDFNNLHIIGHCLGAHVAGRAAQEVTDITGHRVAKITGLDPTGPGFEYGIAFPFFWNYQRKLHRQDAQFVDIYHSNMKVKGDSSLDGHIDFYFNGGTKQPGCHEDFFGVCSHAKVVRYYEQTIRGENYTACGCRDRGRRYDVKCYPDCKVGEVIQNPGYWMDQEKWGPTANTTLAEYYIDTEGFLDSTIPRWVLDSGPDAKLQKVFDYIDTNQDEFIQKLKDMVAIHSVSASIQDPAIHPEFEKMRDFIVAKLKELKFDVKLKATRMVMLKNGKEKKGAPIIFGTKGRDESKATLLIYGHLDVQPAEKEDGWRTEPFQLTERGGNLYGRGASDDKGPILAWLNCIEAFIKTGQELPVNLKVVFDMGEESENENELRPALVKEQNGFLGNVDAVVITDSSWALKDQPTITYALRAITYCQLEIDGGKKDLHSGTFGGAIHEPLWDLVDLLDQLVDQRGRIMVPGVLQEADVVTPAEELLLEELEFDLESFHRESGLNLRFFNETAIIAKVLTQMHRWSYPSLSIHGIEGAFCSPGQKTVIPHLVTGKFSLRMVSGMIPYHIVSRVKGHLLHRFKQLRSPNRINIACTDEGAPWKANPSDWNYKAASNAIETVYKKRPLLTREGGSIQTAVLLQDLTGKSVLLLPMGQSDDGVHSLNEKISKNNYIEGTKVFAAYMRELANNYNKKIANEWDDPTE